MPAFPMLILAHPLERSYRVMALSLRVPPTLNPRTSLSELDVEEKVMKVMRVMSESAHHGEPPVC